MKQLNTKAKSAWALLLCLFLGGLSACSSRRAGFLEGNPFEAYRDYNVQSVAKAPDRERLRILFTGRVAGFLASCGCSVDPKGGLDRRINALNKFRSEFLKDGLPPKNFLLLDAGNSLFENRRIDLSQKSTEMHRVGLFEEAQKLLDIQIQNVGQNDLAAGYNFLVSDTTFGRYLSSNILTSSGKLAFRGEWKNPDAKVLVLGFTEPSKSLPDGLTAVAPLPILQEKLKKVEAGTLVIVLSDLGQKADRALAEAVDYPLLIVGSHEPSSLELPLMVRKSLIVQNQIQGQQWGLIDVSRPKFLAEGWYSSDLGQRFYNRWNELADEERSKSQIKSEAEKDYEFDKLSAMALELKKYAPGEASKKFLFNYSLIDMNGSFDGKNRGSELMDEAARGPELKSQLSPINTQDPTFKKKLLKGH